MKKVIAVFMVVILIFSFTACSLKSDINVSTVAPNSITSQSADNAETYVDDGFLTVDVKIPASLFSDSHPATDVLTDKEKADGFKKAVINADGSVTYTINKRDWQRLVAEMKTEAEDGLQEFVTSGYYPSIKSVDYNDDFSEITFTVDKNAYEENFDSVASSCAYMIVVFYQMYACKEATCTVRIKDISTNEVFDTTVYPDKED